MTDDETVARRVTVTGSPRSTFRSDGFRVCGYRLTAASGCGPLTSATGSASPVPRRWQSGADPDNRERHRQAYDESPGNRQGEFGQQI